MDIISYRPLCARNEWQACLLNWTQEVFLGLILGCVTCWTCKPTILNKLRFLISPRLYRQGSGGGKRGYKTTDICNVGSYLPGRGRRVIKKACGLDQRLALHFAGALVYHHPKWVSGRHNLWQRGFAFARPLTNSN
jgi:hypothetical protein